ATGYPLAFVAAKLGLGYGLHELKNSVTLTTTACFEPALDYIVVKIPRWDLDKFADVSHEIGSSMKSVGEVMAIGRNFEEAIQKGLRMIGQGMHGFVGNHDLQFANLKKELQTPTDVRIFVIAQALESGMSVEKIHELTGIDKWFLDKLQNIIRLKSMLEAGDSLETTEISLIREAKVRGFSDFQITRLILESPSERIEEDMLKVRKFRKEAGIVPFVRQIDTLAAEYPAQTNYLYLTYSAVAHDVVFQHDKESVIVLGSGAYRIGSSVEFDWCSVNGLQTIRKQGYRGIMINYNPETVSTDYDMSDRLYFDELSFERVMDILDLEQPLGVVVSMGGQIPNNLALRLHEQSVPIIGTSPVSIDRAEDRHKFSMMMDTLEIDQPEWQELTSIEDIHNFTDRIGFPVLIRPSYVLSGAAMNVVSNKEELDNYLKLAVRVSKQHPVVVTDFIEQAKEIEIDAVASKGELFAYAISEHVEFAGVHSGDATMVFPPQKLYFETVRRIKKITKQIAKELNITGPFNIQFLAKDNDIKVIECNLRASRSLPFVSKVLKTNLIELATKLMLGIQVEKPKKSIFDLDYIGVKASQFSFSRLQRADPILGVDMSSTGEVGCIGEDFYDAILKSMLSVGYTIPKKSVLLSTGPIKDKVYLLETCHLLDNHGYQIFATPGTEEFLRGNGIPATVLHWPDDKKVPNVTEYIRGGLIDLVVNIPKNLSQGELKNDYTIRRNAIDFNVPLITNARLATAFINAFCKLDMEDISIKAWKEY
ncbi:MAG: carbamoyl-phosphate synthase large subunit, partial [Bacteroidales bacterium]|nr:carbamoyl-phosphate synthase large subunit [Bacteroidales bacterium]